MLTAQAVADRFGAAAPGDAEDRMVALGIRVRDVATAARMASVRPANGTALVPHDAACGVALAYMGAD